jgi:Protein O-mannosyl-transferase TMEM260-like
MTLCPTVPPRDSAELITVAYTLGIAHPPGYPLYTMLGKLFTLIPFGSIAWRVNLMSAFFASITVSLTYLIGFKLTKNQIAAIVSALLLAFAPFFWSLALVAEVFQLNVFFAALLIYILILWRERREFYLLLLLSFIAGLSLTNHHTIFLLFPGFLYYIFITDKTVFFKLKNYIILGLSFGLGLLPYLYLPIRSLFNPVLDWGDPQTLKNFIAVVTRQQYGTLRLDPNFVKSTSIFIHIKTYFIWLYDNFTILGIILGVIGVIKSFRDNFRFFNFLLILFLFSGAGFMLLVKYPLAQTLFYPYCLAILRRFLLPSLLVFALWIGIGIAATIDWLKIKKTAYILLLIPVISLTINYKIVDMSNYYYVEDVLNNIILSVKPNSILFANGDTTLFGLWYMQQVRGVRKDIKVISSKQYNWRAKQVLLRWPALTKRAGNTYQSGQEFLADIIDNNIGKFNIYSDLYHPYKFKKHGKNLAPNGLTFEFIADPSKKAKKVHMLKNRYLWSEYKFKSPLSKANKNNYFTVEIINYYKMDRAISNSLY